MDPSTLLIGKGIDAAAMLGGRFLGGLAPQPGGPAISSAQSGGTLSAPFNVGSGVGSPSQIGAIAQWAPWIVIGVVAWALIQK